MSLGLFQVLNMASRAMQTQQAGIEVAGQNLSNVNNPNYSRQVLDVSTSEAVPTDVGIEGTGVQATGVEQIVSQAVNAQIQNENSVSSYWQTQQQFLGFAQADLSQQVSGGSSSGTTSGQGIAGSLSDFFNELQTFSTEPGSLSERQVLLAKAGTLASQFNQISGQLSTLQTQVNSSLQTDVTNANQLLSDIASLNKQIATSKVNAGSEPNDLLDLREQKIESLANLVNVNVSPQSNGDVNISIGGVQMVDGAAVADAMQTYDAGGGQFLVKAATAGTDLTLTGGSIAGEIDVRDGALGSLSSGIDTLASQLITSVNAAHATGYGLTGTNNQLFFTGSGASDIAVNQALVNNPALIQASGTQGATGDNAAALAMAQLANQLNPGLNNQTFSQAFDGSVATMGQSLSSASDQVSQQNTVQQALQQQRSSISGVSLVEEMGNLSVFQNAYEASAHIMSVVDEMLQTLVNIQ